jgi:hypothetical protein
MAAGGLAAVAAGAAGGVELVQGRERIRRIGSFAVKPSGAVRTFHSRPDLKPPTVAASAGTSPEARASEDQRFLFLGPGPVALKGSQQYGPLIVDRGGEPVWFRPVAPGLEVTNFSSSRYRDEPVLMWWEGKIDASGYGQGEAVIVDRGYRELARIRAANGRWMDLHALWLTPAQTAVFTCYPRVVQADLSSLGGPREGQALESIIQEVDIASGRLIFEWASLSHVPIGDSYQHLGTPFDYLHVNSVRPTPDGNLLVSGRNTWALYKLDRRSGEVVWTLGGKRSDFEVGESAQFAWQHNAEQVTDRLLTVFDNGTDGPTRTQTESRGLALNVDEPRRAVELRNAYTSPESLLASAMGSVQILPSGHVVVGWGTASHTTEFAADGKLVLDASLPAGLYSFLGLLLDWSSAPHRPPTVTVSRDLQGGAKLVYASWNGATEVTDWRVDAGVRADSLHPVGIAKRRGFETAIPVHRDLRFAALTALDASGNALGRSDTVRL